MKAQPSDSPSTPMLWIKARFAAMVAIQPRHRAIVMRGLYMVLPRRERRSSTSPRRQRASECLLAGTGHPLAGASGSYEHLPRRDNNIDQDGEVITSAGISAGIDLALRVVARHRGEAVARATPRHMAYPFPEHNRRRV